MAKLRLQDLAVKGKRVLMRVDFNVPLNEDGTIADDSRIQAVLPSIQYILQHEGSIILMSHLGRPKGKKDPKFSLQPCAKRLSELLKKNVLMAPDCIGTEVQRLVTGLRSQEIILLENLRFYEAEEKPESDPTFVKQLAALGDLYVNDAFGTAHRAHSSTTLIAKEFIGKAAAGFLLQKEIKFLGAALLNPKRPFYAVIGGAKISSKLGVLKSLIQKADGLLIGGAMAYTFLKAQGFKIGKSIFEEDLISTATQILEECAQKDIALLLPKDLVVADEFSNDANTQIISIEDGVPDGWEGMDIGPKTTENFKKYLKNGATILWNGPLGVTEMPNFSKGTKAIAECLAQSQAITIVGGGDSIAALQSMGLADQIDHVSTGGGASLEYLEFGTLPGVEALSDSIETVKTNRIN